jgi:RHH-type proline utilization regulon transcriptional repressor/proline dehydrogenase/delta 1-pyrroline-5-carboxylate dehydrogenase
MVTDFIHSSQSGEDNPEEDWFIKEKSSLNPHSISYLLQETAHHTDKELSTFLQNNNPFTEQEYQSLKQKTLDFIESLKQQTNFSPQFTEFLNYYQLTSEEGIALLSLAEALVRIPDSPTADLLIHDQLNTHQWSCLFSPNSPSFIKFSAWALSRLGNFFSSSSSNHLKKDFQNIFVRLIKKSGDTVLCQALLSATRLLGDQCIFAENSTKALKKSAPYQQKGYLFGYQLLGKREATTTDAEEFYAACAETIRTIGAKIDPALSALCRPSITFKISDLHPRYCLSQTQRIMNEVGPKLTNLAMLAKEKGIGLIIEAEESSKLPLSLKLMEHLVENPRLQEWQGLGIVIQAYQKRSPFVIQWLADLARRHQHKIAIRLVKGLLWDQEIRQAQEEQNFTYPVYTEKQATDASFFVCAQKMIEASDVITPYFSTHNVFSIMGILALVQKASEHRLPFYWEFHKGYRTGEGIFSQLLEQYKIPCRIIALLGDKKRVLPSVIRHFMENKVNHSFLYEINKTETSCDHFVQNPFNSLGKKTENLSACLNSLEESNKIFPLSFIKKIDFLRYKNVPSNLLEEQNKKFYEAAPIINGIYQSGKKIPLYNPSHKEKLIGYCIEANEAQAKQALEVAFAVKTPWESLEKRIVFLKQLANLLQERLETLIYLSIVEAGLTMHDAVEEFLEAIRTCHKIAQDLKNYEKSSELADVWNEKHLIQWESRGIFVCLTTWNSPILSVVQALAAALGTGNTVILKPSFSASLIAAEIVDCFYSAGVPKEALQFLPGTPSALPFELLNDIRIAGVAFFGSERTSLKVRGIIAEQEKLTFSFIPHTYGMNVMIVDSTALLNQAVEESIQAAFGHSGQSAHALRLIFVQEEIAEDFIKLLKSKMIEWSVGDPLYCATDSGPIINEKAYRKLVQHAEAMHDIGTLLCRSPSSLRSGWFFPPKVYELQEATHLTLPAFGPILHLIRFKREEIQDIIQQLNQHFPGLVLSIQSILPSFCNTISTEIKSTKVFINRSVRAQIFHYSSSSKEERLEYLKKFVFQKNLFILK